MPMLAAVGGIAASLAGAGISAAGASAQAKNEQQLASFEAQQYQQEGYSAIAMSQRKAEEAQLRGRYLQSSLQAKSSMGAASNVGSPEVLAQQIAGRTEYASLMDLAHGQSLAAGYQNQASGASYQGQLAESMVPLQQAGAFAGAAGSIFSSFGRMASGNMGGFSFG